MSKDDDQRSEERAFRILMEHIAAQFADVQKLTIRMAFDEDGALQFSYVEEGRLMTVGWVDYDDSIHCRYVGEDSAIDTIANAIKEIRNEAM